nr:site-specific integrase [uncultured Pseudodesulfovibrio sp.]
MSVHKRKNNGTYYVSYRDDHGKQRTKSFGKGAAGKRDAEAFDHEVKSKKLRGQKVMPPNNGMYLDELAQAWINVKKAEGKGGRWLKDWASILNNSFLPGLPTVPVNALTQEDILSFVMKRYAKRSHTTRNRYLSYLKVMFNFGLDHNLIDSNPLEKWKKTKEKPRQSTLTFRQLKKIKKHAAPHLAWALDVAFHLGVRTGQSELLSLRWENVDWENNEVRIFATKTNTWRVVPVSDFFLGELNRKLREAKTAYIVEYRGRPVKSIRKAFRTACTKAGIEESVITYDIRHLFATSLLNKGGDLASVSAMMGHASTKMTADQYYHSLKSEKTRTIKLLPNL